MKSKHLLFFLLKRIDPILPLTFLIVCLVWIFHSSLSPKSSIFYLNDSSYTASFEVSTRLNEDLLIKNFDVYGIVYGGYALMQKSNLEIGDKVSCFGSLKSPRSFPGFDYLEYLHNKHIYKTFMCEKDIKVQKASINILKIGDDIKKDMLNKVNGNLSSEEAAIFDGVVIGDKESFPTYLNNDFIRTGTSHIAVLSGFNITIINTLVYILLSFLRSKWSRFIIANICLIFFIWIVGFGDSILRAYTQSIMLTLSIVLFRGSNRIRIICLSLLIAILIDSNLLFSISYQLSFMATSALLFLSESLFFGKKFKLIQFFEIIKQTFIAILGTLPLTVNNFGILSTVALLVNSLILPLVEIISILGFFIIIFLEILPPIGIILLKPLGVLCKYIFEVVHTFGSMSFSSINLNFKMTALGIVLYYLIFVSYVSIKCGRNLYSIYKKVYLPKISI